jgi:Zn-dependent hydrolases, including glyoxylases
MIQILKNVYLVESSMGANVYLVDNGNSFDLIDSGIFKGTNELILQIEDFGFDIKNLRKIILTHCHCDHIGGAAELVRRSGAMLAAHTADIPFMLQSAVIPGPYHNLMLQEQMFMRRFECTISEVNIELADDDMIDSLGGLQVIHVPGHTPGSIALYQANQQIMFFGDVIRNNDHKGLVIGIPEKFNIDTPQVLKDAGKLLNYPITYALFGHGAPLLKNTKRLLMTAQAPDEITASKTSKKGKNGDRHQ